MAFDAGTIGYDVAIDIAKFRSEATKLDREAERAAKTTGKKFSDSFRQGSADISDSFDGISRALGGMIKAVVSASVAGSVGIGAMAKAAFDQVRQVENASFALRAYEKDADKVNQVLGDLVGFARSDMGVLFQRQELFKAASNLRGFGEESDRLVDRVKILSRGVALGMTNFDELSQIVGRATQAGKLSAEQFDQLAYRGIILDSSLRGATVSSEELYSALSTALPESILEGRANTIDGVIIRLQSAFRDLGSAILGVDADTSKFTEGGLGSRLVDTMMRLRDTLASPEFKTAFRELGASIADFAEKALPIVLDGFMFMINNRDTIAAFFGALVVGFVAARIAAIAFSIAASANPLGLLAAAIVAVISVLTFLELRFGLLSAAARIAGDIIGNVAGLYVAVFNRAREGVAAAIGVIISTFGNLQRGAINVVNNVVNFFRDLPGRILGALANIGSVLYNSGRDLINGLINGAGSVLRNIGNFFLDLVPGWIKDPFKAALGISSPSKVFAGFGLNIGEGLVQGVERSVSSIKGAASEMSRAVVGGFAPTLNPSLAGASFGSTTLEAVVSGDRLAEGSTRQPLGGTNAEIVNNYNITQGMTPEQIARAQARELRRI